MIKMIKKKKKKIEFRIMKNTFQTKPMTDRKKINENNDLLIAANKPKNM